MVSERERDKAFNFIMNVCESKYEAGSTANVDTDVASGDLEQIHTDTEALVFNPPLFDPHVLHSTILQNRCVCLLKDRLPSKKYNNKPIRATDYSGSWPCKHTIVCLYTCMQFADMFDPLLVFWVAQHKGPDCVVVARAFASRPSVRNPRCRQSTLGYPCVRFINSTGSIYLIYRHLS